MSRRIVWVLIGAAALLAATFRVEQAIVLSAAGEVSDTATLADGTPPDDQDAPLAPLPPEPPEQVADAQQSSAPPLPSRSRPISRPPPRGPPLPQSA